MDIAATLEAIYNEYIAAFLLPAQLMVQGGLSMSVSVTQTPLAGSPSPAGSSAAIVLTGGPASPSHPAHARLQGTVDGVGTFDQLVDFTVSGSSAEVVHVTSAQWVDAANVPIPGAPTWTVGADGNVVGLSSTLP